jgi:hypothetical protein
MKTTFTGKKLISSLLLTLPLIILVHLADRTSDFGLPTID